MNPQEHEIPIHQPVILTLSKFTEELGRAGGWREPHLSALLGKLTPPKATMEGNNFGLCLNEEPPRIGQKMGT